MAKSVRQTKTYRSVVAQINAHVAAHSVLMVDWGRWYVGITCDVERSAGEHGLSYSELVGFRSFYARTDAIASAVVDFYARKGAYNYTGAQGAVEGSRWVHVFKAHPTLQD